MAKAAVEQKWWCGAAAVVAVVLPLPRRWLGSLRRKKANDKRAGVGRPSEGLRVWDQSAL